MHKFYGIKNQTGQALVEAAFALPILLLLSFLVIDAGTGFFVRGSMNNIARDEARILATDPKLNPNYRPPAGLTQTPQQAVTQAISDAKTRITIRITPIAGMGKPLSVSNDGIQILVPGVNGTPGNLTDNPVEVRITRQLSLITANFIPSEVASRILSTTVSASAFVEKGTISGDINLDGVIDPTNPIDDTTELCAQAGICTCKTTPELCTPNELCTIRGTCTEQQRCDLLQECTCKTQISLCSKKELCDVRGDVRACCETYGGADGTGKKPNGQDACSLSWRCYLYDLKTDECCQTNWQYCPGNGYCEIFTNAAKFNSGYKYHENLYCCINNNDQINYPKNSPTNPYCCAHDANICNNDSQKCALNDFAACCRLKLANPAAPGAEKCNCQNDVNQCDSGGACLYYPGTAKCCESDPVKCCQNNIALCKQEEICLYHSTSDQCCQKDQSKCSDYQACVIYGTNAVEACCRYSPSNATCVNAKCADGRYSTAECCAYKGDKSETCCAVTAGSCATDELLCAYHKAEDAYKDKCAAFEK